MSDHAAAELNPHGSHAAPASFSETELKTMHSDDFAAGKAVVILMLGIFSTGVLIYAIVAYWVMFLSHGA